MRGGFGSLLLLSPIDDITDGEDSRVALDLERRLDLDKALRREYAGVEGVDHRSVWLWSEGRNLRRDDESLQSVDCAGTYHEIDAGECLPIARPQVDGRSGLGELVNVVVEDDVDTQSANTPVDVLAELVWVRAVQQLRVAMDDRNFLILQIVSGTA